MDPVNPWINPTHVRQLAEGLLQPFSESDNNASEPGIDDSFIGFTSLPISGSPINIATSRINQEPTPSSIDAELPEIPSEQRDLSLPINPESYLLQRVQIFRDWLSQNFNAKDTFVIDLTGKIIFDETDHGRFHFMARNLMLSSQKTGFIQMKIESANLLVVIPCETNYGRWMLGTLLGERLSSEQMNLITEVFLQTASPP